MRIKLLGIGFILLFFGLALSAISRNAVTREDENLEKIAEGYRDVPEVSNVSLTQGEKFVAKYYGGGSYVDPNEVIVNVFDPYHNLTAGISYGTQFQNGISANYTGLYTVQVGAPGLLDPRSPLQIVIFRMVVTSRIEYPNLNLLPYAFASILVGVSVCTFSIVSRRKPTRSTRRTAK